MVPRGRETPSKVHPLILGRRLQDEVQRDMSLTLGEIIQTFEEHIPLSYQESYDRSGLQVGSRKLKVKKVLFALDVCREVLEAAIQSKSNLIVSHHPLQMRDWKNIDL